MDSQDRVTRTIGTLLSRLRNSSARPKQSLTNPELSSWLAAHPELDDQIQQGLDDISTGRGYRISREGYSKSSQL